MSPAMELPNKGKRDLSSRSEGGVSDERVRERKRGGRRSAETRER